MANHQNTTNHRAWWCSFFLFMLILTIAVRWNVVGLDREVKREGLSSQVFVTARNVLVAVLDIETGLRGYLIVGRPDFLRPYHEGLGRLDEDLARLRGLTALDPTEREHTRAASEVITHVIEEFVSEIDIVQQEGVDAARTRFLDNPTKLSVDLIRDHLLAIQVEEMRKVSEATNSLNRQMSATYLLLDTFTLVTFLLLVAMFLGMLSAPIANRADCPGDGVQAGSPAEVGAPSRS